jgi:N4-(beta-N-acetylglucosaminyl)-L-asparaginase
MTTTRRLFLQKSVAAFGGLVFLRPGMAGFAAIVKGDPVRPVVVSTWPHGVPANEAAWRILSAGGYALDAVEAGVRVPEGDPKVTSVGYGGIPDARGKVTLDACIMNEKGEAGAVAFLRHIKHPISVARLVMEKTPHVMLTGKGALRFALENGFEREKLLTRERRKAWKQWKKEQKRSPAKINEANHDTIGMLAIDAEGRLCGACTTSGLGYKMPGRVGDSPIIGAGLFVDGKVGGAAATGTGELVMKTVGSFLVVEMMRQGMSPEKACQEAVFRIAEKIPGFEKHQVGYIALNIRGEYGGFCIQPDFQYAVQSKAFTGTRDAEAFLKRL